MSQTFPRPLILTDLDDTLFQTARKMDPVSLETAVRVSEAATGNHSYMTTTQKNFFNWLRATADVVAVTARTLAGFRKVDLDFSGNFAVVANGAIIIKPDGEIDTDWTAELARMARDFQDEIRLTHESISTLAERDGADIRVALNDIGDGETPCMIVVKVNNHETNGLAFLEQIKTHVTISEGWTTHLNGNNLAYTIPGVSKRLAVRHVIEQLGGRQDRPIIGMGDSLTDIPFMSLADFAVSPNAGQIAERIGLD